LIVSSPQNSVVAEPRPVENREGGRIETFGKRYRLMSE
jgi:hypothetical protein